MHGQASDPLPAAALPDEPHQGPGGIAPGEQLPRSSSGYEPFDSWEEVCIAHLYARNRIPRTELDLLLRLLKERSFDNRKLPTCIEDLLSKINQLPLPTVSEMFVDIHKRKNKLTEVVDCKSVFYFDVEATIRRAFADPLVRETIRTTAPTPIPDANERVQVNFLDSDFSRNPVSVSKLVTFDFQFEGKSSTATIGDFVRLDSGETVLLTDVKATASGGFTLHGEHWKPGPDKKTETGKAELVRTQTVVDFCPQDVEAPVTVLDKEDFHRRIDEDQDVDMASVLRWSASEAHRRGTRVFDRKEHLKNLTQVLELPIGVKNGRHLFIKLYLDGLFWLQHPMFIAMFRFRLIQVAIRQTWWPLFYLRFQQFAILCRRICGRQSTRI